MSSTSSAQTTNLYRVVADIQEQMEDSGFSTELVDAIVARGLSILFGLPEEERSTP